MNEAIKNRYDFEMLFDVKNGNPNGDPDAGNMPRIDPETGYGVVTGECIRRKIRNYIDIVKADDPNYYIYIKQDATLNAKDNKAFEQFGIENAAADSKLKEKLKELKKKKQPVDELVRDYMCSHFFDIRTFGAVVTTATKGALNCGQIKGPVQIDMAESVDPVTPREITITRMAITKDSDAENKQNEMGNKFIIPYGLYCAKGHISAFAAQKTGFSAEDLNLLWNAILNMFEEDHSAQRGEMALRKLYIFRHDSLLGNAPAHKLLDLVHVSRKTGVETARSFNDYQIEIDRNSIPEGVELIERD